MYSVDEIKSLLEMLEKHGVSECKIEHEGEKITLKRNQIQQFVSQAPVPQQVVSQVANQSVSLDSSNNASKVIEEESNLLEVTSPMVGTFYRKPAVDAEPYVEVGDIVKKGDVLCIVEAMKLMNEIVSEHSGKISEICLADSKMVEYGEVLFKVEPN